MLVPKLFGKSEEAFLCGQLSEHTERLESIGVWPVGLPGFPTVMHGGEKAMSLPWGSSSLEKYLG